MLRLVRMTANRLANAFDQTILFRFLVRFSGKSFVTINWAAHQPLTGRTPKEQPDTIERIRSDGLNVIGSGFGRTGTMSTKMALEELGFGPCHHMVEVMANPAQPTHWDAWAAGEDVDWERCLPTIRHRSIFPGPLSGTSFPSHFRMQN